MGRAAKKENKYRKYAIIVLSVFVIVLFLSSIYLLYFIAQLEEKLSSATTAQGRAATDSLKKESGIFQEKKYLFLCDKCASDNGAWLLTTMDGKQTVKTIKQPADLAKGAGNSAVFGDKIYYLSGDDKITTIAQFDPFSDTTKKLEFTKSTSTNIGNTLFAITAFDVSKDDAKIAWMTTDGKIFVADIDGSNIKEFKSGYTAPINGSLEFSKNKDYLYFDADSSNRAVLKLDLANNKVLTVEKTQLGAHYALSPSEKYLAYGAYEKNSGVINVKNSETGVIKKIKVGNYDSFDYMRFDPDEKRLAFTAKRFGEKIDSYIATIETGKVQLLSESASSGQFLNSNEMIVYKDKSYILDLTSMQYTELPGWFEGVINRK